MKLLVLGMIMTLALAQPVTPGFLATLDGWVRYESPDGTSTLWLPASGGPGEQRVFLLQSAGQHVDAWLPSWLGGGEVIWEGAFEAGGVSWQGGIADNGTLRGLVVRSESGEWTLAAVAPSDAWAVWAGDFNAILRGAQ